jgi:hypothetical protein
MSMHSVAGLTSVIESYVIYFSSVRSRRPCCYKVLTDSTVSANVLVPESNFIKLNLLKLSGNFTYDQV